MTTLSDSAWEARRNSPISVLARKILLASPMAKRLPFKEVSIGSWRPEAAKCHDNAKHWVASNKGCRVVYGWLVESFGVFHYLYAHSVVQDADGILFDITPYLSANRQILPFVPHSSDDAQFNHSILAGGRIVACNDDTAYYG